MTAGFKGWLFLLAVGIWSSIFSQIKEATSLFGDKNEIYDKFYGLWVIDSTVTISGCALTSISLILMLRRSRHFLASFIVHGAFSIVSPYLSAVLASIILKNHNINMSVLQVLEANAELIGRWVPGTILVVCWLIYLRRSRRVALTFVR